MWLDYFTFAKFPLGKKILPGPFISSLMQLANTSAEPESDPTLSKPSSFYKQALLILDKIFPADSGQTWTALLVAWPTT